MVDAPFRGKDRIRETVNAQFRGKGRGQFRGLLLRSTMYIQVIIHDFCLTLSYIHLNVSKGALGEILWGWYLAISLNIFLLE